MLTPTEMARADDLTNNLSREVAASIQGGSDADVALCVLLGLAKVLAMRAHGSRAYEVVNAYLLASEDGGNVNFRN